MKKEQKINSCIFCDLDKLPLHIEYYGNCLIFEPLNPATEGHLLIINRQHSKDFTDDIDIFTETVRVASMVAKQKGGDYNLITSKGKNATQSVFHLHIHLIPRKENDNLQLPWNNL